MDEARFVLDAIHERLSDEPAELVAPMVRDDQSIELLAGQVELGVEVRHDEGAHPAIAHAHVLVTLRGPKGERRLEGCVVAVHPDRVQGLRGAGKTFCDLVAGPVLSLVHRRAVMGSTAFDLATPGAIPGQQGYFGPSMVRGLATGTGDPFVGMPTFDYADTLAPPGDLHIAKVVFDVRDDGVVRRTIEVDGHAASHVDRAWRDNKAPPNLVGVRFAVFEPTDPRAERAARALDEAISAFVEHFAATRDRDAAADRLAESGVAPRVVHDIRLFVPAAHARLVYDDLPLSPTFTRVKADGWTDEDLPFPNERTFARAFVLGRQRIARDGDGLVREIGRTSSEVAAIEHAVRQGASRASLRPLAPLVPDPDVSVEVLERVAKELYG